MSQMARHHHSSFEVRAQDLGSGFGFQMQVVDGFTCNCCFLLSGLCEHALHMALRVRTC